MSVACELSGLPFSPADDSATHDGPQGPGTSSGGAIAGNGRQVWVQIVGEVAHYLHKLTSGLLFVVGWNLAWTPLILFAIRAVFRVPLRAPDEVLIIGDDAIHGEEAYSLSMPDRQPAMPGGDPYQRMAEVGSLHSTGPGDAIPLSNLEPGRNGTANEHVGNALPRM